jgi:hypothetical protein
MGRTISLRIIMIAVWISLVTGQQCGENSATVNFARSCGRNSDAVCETEQSSDHELAFTSSRALNARLSNRLNNDQCTHTRVEKTPWWRVDFDSAVTVTSLILYGRDVATERTMNFSIFVGNDTSTEGRFVNNKVCVQKQLALPVSGFRTINCTIPVSGRYLYFAVFHDNPNFMTICQIQVFGSMRLSVNLGRSCGVNKNQQCDTKQSTTYGDKFTSESAVDGSSISRFGDGTCTSTRKIEDKNSWWRLDMQLQRKIIFLDVLGQSIQNSENTAGFHIFIGNDTTEEG